MPYRALLPSPSATSNTGRRIVCPTHLLKSVGEQPLGGEFPGSDGAQESMSVTVSPQPSVGSNQPNPPGTGLPLGPLQPESDFLAARTVRVTPASGIWMPMTLFAASRIG